MPSLSFSPRASSMFSVPEQAEEPNKLFPNRAPSSSAQSTSRTVTGGLPPYWSLMRRRISTPASRFRHPSSHPPLGTESICPPISSARSDPPVRVAQKLPAASVCASTGSASSLSLSHARAAAQVLVKATRCAPFSSPVRRAQFLQFGNGAFWVGEIAHRLGEILYVCVLFDFTAFQLIRLHLPCPVGQQSVIGEPAFAGTKKQFSKLCP